MMRTQITMVMVLALLVGNLSAAEWGLKSGAPELQSAGPLAIGPEGILFVGDAKGATIFAIHPGELAKAGKQAEFQVDDLAAAVAKAVGGAATIKRHGCQRRSSSYFLYRHHRRWQACDCAARQQRSIQQARLEQSALLQSPAEGRSRRRGNRPRSTAS